MISRRPGRTALLVLAAAFLAALVLPLTARPASACIVSYDYRPNIKIDLSKPGSAFGKPCSDGTSYTGVVLVVALAIAAFGIAGVRTIRRGTALTATPVPDQAGARRVILAGYLQAAGFRLPPPNPAAPPYGGPGMAGQPPAAPPYPAQGGPYPGPAAPYPGYNAPYPGAGRPYSGPARPYPDAGPPYQDPAAPPGGPPQSGPPVPSSDPDQAGDR